MTDDADTSPKKRMGRPPKPPSEVKRHGIAFRVNDKLRARIQQSAEDNQRSLAEEVEYRLQISADIAPVMEALATDKVTQELLRTVSRCIKSTRATAERIGLNEIDTRIALKAAFDHISEINFWTGGELPAPPEGYIGDADKPPLKMSEKSPQHIGYSIALEVMVFNSTFDDCMVMEDLGKSVMNYWSGDGRTASDVAPPPAGGRSKRGDGRKA